MKYVIVAAFNNQFEAFMPPQALNDMLDEDIVESNRRAVISGRIPVDQAKHLTLFKLGSFDDEKGVITPIKPELLCNLKDFLPRENKVITQEVKTDGESAN